MKRLTTLVCLAAFELTALGCDPQAVEPGADPNEPSLVAPAAAQVLEAQAQAKAALPANALKQHAFADESIAITRQLPTTSAESVPKGVEVNQSALFGINACWAWYASPLFWQGVWAIQELRDDDWSYFQSESSCKTTLRNLTPLGLNIGFTNPLYLALVALSYSGGSCACERAL